MKVIFNSSNKHPLYTFLALSELVLDHAKVKILLISSHFLVVFLVYLICQFIDTLMFWYIKVAQVMQICVKIQFIISRPRFIYVISGPRFIYAWFLVLEFWNFKCFNASRKYNFRLLLDGFLDVTYWNVVKCVWNFNQWCNAL